MNLAIEQAKKAFAANEVPIGAIVVDKNGKVIGRGYNKIETMKTQLAHAEVTAIKKAGKKIGDWRLNDCWLYVTLEPCTMCFGLIQLSRLKGVVFGAKSPLFGHGLSETKIKDQNLPELKKDLVIQGGVQKEKCIKLLQKFFKIVRSGSNRPAKGITFDE